LPTQLRLGLPSGLFRSGFPTNILYTFLFSISATCPAHLILLHLIILIVLHEECKLWSFSLCSCLQPSVTSSLFGPNILLSNLFSNTLSLCSSLNIRDQDSHSYRTTGKIIVLYILIFMFLDSRREDKKFWTEWSQAIWTSRKWKYGRRNWKEQVKITNHERLPWHARYYVTYTNERTEIDRRVQLVSER
jgi:hypothetical protein